MENAKADVIKQSFKKLMLALSPSLALVVAFMTDRIDAIPIALIISTCVTLLTTASSRLDEKQNSSRVNKILAIVAVLALGFSLIVTLFVFENDFQTLLDVVKNKEYETNIYDIFNKHRYVLSVVLYFLSFLPYLWDLVIAIATYMDRPIDNRFDITAANIN